MRRFVRQHKTISRRWRGIRLSRDSPNAERDCDAALAAFKRHIRHREADIIADLLDGLEEAKSQLNEQRESYEAISDTKAYC